MKKELITILFAFTVINMFGQTPTTSKPDKTNYSNDKLLPNEVVTNKVISPLQKVELDEVAILIYDYDGSIFSYDFDSEDNNWTVKATDANTEMCANKVTIHDGVVYIPFINGEIFAIDNVTGDAFWKSRLGNITDQIILKDQTPVIHNGKLYITAQNQDQTSNLYALNTKDGSLAWTYKLDTPNNDIPVLFFDNKIFTQSASNVYSFDANTGKVLNQKTFEEPMYGKPVTDGENVFIANEKDLLFALSPNKLDILWQFKLDENQHNIKERIFSKDKKVYFAAHGSKVSSVYAVDSKTGTQLWKTDFKDDNVEYITEHDDTLWGYTRKGKLFKLDLSNGQIILEIKLTTIPVSNIEFPEDDNLFYYYCDAGLIQYNLQDKEENVYYMRTSLKDNIYSAYIKLVQ
ncbi:outer membrane protein assembly factor BamB family protein [Flavobacterium hydatis]|uniref:Pyrrolo-quinoline quinone n=1 Tax=Flavobacterium hydatis TaxID=991 RepID=A0A086AQ71_FLAHY|nr:PQQ-binding-like beta-propeller repeat protein [Flavobacterium hydatis]KFF18835.1 pyrrolo-quinoline quinone [Flavobacterium hydatis]OXA88886.1 pyrrolo-quinoline quinone [Flavobacterium hydatis]